MKLYLASGFHQRMKLRSLATTLESHGHQVVSDWIWIDERPEHMDPKWPEFAEKICHKNIIDLYRADALVIDAEGITPTNHGGAHSELGFMLARGKPIFLIGGLANTFSYAKDVIHLIKSTNEVETFYHLLEALKSQEIVKRQPIII